ncbi:protein kinase, partial [Actinomycetaceae bacterium L2_0104]
MTDQWNLGSSYVIDREIGSGGMGNVWLGHDREGTRYAVKVLREELARDPEVLRRFVRERSVLLGLDHPGLVRVHDLVVEKNILAIVMDFVDGPDLRHFLAGKGTLAPQQAARLVGRIAEGLRAVHTVGIVHRDLKPENILIESPEDAQLPKLADFGIATIAVEGAQTSTAIIGTPHYMAPELFDGKAPSAAVDIYSLGIILYELLCGIQPYRGTPVQLIAQHATSRPGRPGGIPDALWQAIDDMTSIEPEARPDAARIAERMRTLADSLGAIPALTKLNAPPPPVRIGGVQPATSVSIWSNPTVPVSRHDVPAQSQQQNVAGPYAGNQVASAPQHVPANPPFGTPQQFAAGQGTATPQQFGGNQRVGTPQPFATPQAMQARAQPQRSRTSNVPWKAVIAGLCAVVLIAVGLWGVSNGLSDKTSKGGGGTSTVPPTPTTPITTPPSPSPSTP